MSRCTFIFSGPAECESRAREALIDAGWTPFDHEPQTWYSDGRAPDERFVGANGVEDDVLAAIEVVRLAPGWYYRGAYALPNLIGVA